MTSLKTSSGLENIKDMPFENRLSRPRDQELKN